MACKTASPSCEESDAALPASGMLTFANDNSAVILLLQLVRIDTDKFLLCQLIERPDNGVLELNGVRRTFGFVSHQTVYYRFEQKHDRKKMWVPVKPSGLQVADTVNTVYFGSMRYGRIALDQAFKWETLEPLELDEFFLLKS